LITILFKDITHFIVGYILKINKMNNMLIVTILAITTIIGMYGFILMIKHIVEITLGIETNQTKVKSEYYKRNNL
tara:strand:- start:158 stop:382 length:225 start_codon:yes stop_codon:yes gene_type:complete